MSKNIDLKLLLTTPDAIINNQTGDFFPGIIDVLTSFNNKEENGIVVVSQSGHGLAMIPEAFNPIHIKAALRGSPKFIDFLHDELNLEIQDIIVLGCKDKDVQQAANSKLLLLRADYAITNNTDSIIYENQYGIGIANAEKLQSFFEMFENLNGGWYYQLDVSDKTKLYALTDANTKNKPLNEVALNNRFKQCLKDGNTMYRIPFMIYFLVSTYSIVKEFSQVHYWGVYPSSSTDINEDLEYFKDKARQSYKGISKEPILIRTTSVQKRHLKGRDARIAEGCDSQLGSIEINPYYKGKLKGKCICIIDDFTTYGTSCETARALLEAAGVARLIFICLGKFGKEYHKYNYTITGDIYGHIDFIQTGHNSVAGHFNNTANFAFIKALRVLM